jgi:hypothetical protein
VKSGLLLLPFHSSRANTTTSLHRDLDLVERLDQVGFDEFLFGEVSAILMLMGHEWASPQATLRSFELFAEYVIPEVNRVNEAKLRSQQSFFGNLEAGKEAGARAVKQTIAKYEAVAR